MAATETKRETTGLDEKVELGHNIAKADESSSDEVIHTFDHGFNDGVVELPPDEQRRILRKVDYRLVPLLAFLYLVAYIDRSNIGNAKIAGMAKDLKLVGLKYNIAVTMFFIPYSLLEVPTNIVLKILRPSVWIAILMLAWGTVMTLMGLVTTRGGLYAARFCLGVAESGFFPAAAYLLTIWYRRYEVQSRLAVMYTSASLSGAFSGLLAFAIEKMKGIRHYDGWQWIFILEGLVPCAMAFVIWFILPDSPETARFLTKKEKEFIINRLAIETGSGSGRVTNADRISIRHIVAGLSEWKIWCAWIIFWANTIGVYGFTATVPSVVESLGYTSADAQLMTIPIYVVAMLFTLIIAIVSDRYKERSPFIILGMSIGVFGFIAQLAIPHTHATSNLTYGFLFPVAIGLYCAFVPLVSWIGNNLAPSSKRAVGMALLISVGNMGGIAGSNIYLAREAPKYPAGFGTGLAMCLAAILATIFLRWQFARENRAKRALIAEEGEEAIRARFGEHELLELGDKSPFFIYTL